MSLSLLPPSWATRLARSGQALATLALLAAAPAVQAQTIYGLGTITGSNFRNEPLGSQGLIRIDPNTGASLTLAPIRITGVTAGQTLVGIDYRPADNLLYALGYNGSLTSPTANAQLYTLDPGTDVATPVGSAIRLELGSTGDGIGFDFNPTVDRLRVVSANDTNYRLNPNDGSLTATDGTLNYAGGTPANPGVGTAAYTNSFVGSTTTTLYDLDYLNGGQLSIQNPPNVGTLTTQSTLQLIVTSGSSPGTYVLSSPRHLGLDIYFNPGTNANVGYLTEVTSPRPVFGGTSRASNFYRLDLATGQATLLGNTVSASSFTNFEIRDVAAALLPVPALVWNGSTSTDWRTAANWTPAQVPGPFNDVTIPGGTPFQPTINQAQQTRAFTLMGGATLTLPSGGYLVTGGNFTNNGGTLNSSGTGTVVLDLNTPQTIGGTAPTTFQNLIIGSGTASLATAATLAAPASIRGLLTLFGNLTVSGQTFTLLSDAAGTAQVYNITGAVVGPATVQRYIAPANAGLGYRHYSPPVSGSTVADLAAPGFAPVVNSTFNTVGTTAVPFPNVYGYDQARVGSGVTAYAVIDEGYFSPGGLGDALNPTQGYTVNLTGTVKVDFVGTLGNGPISTPGLPRSGHPNGGWHLRGNPYPAPVDWQLMIDNGRLPGMENALYIFKSSGQYTGTYGTYIGGISANGGSNLIPSGQGFYVRTAAGQTGQLAFSNNERLTTYANPTFQRGAADTRPQLNLSLRGSRAALQTVVYFDAAATPAFDATADAHYLPASPGLLLATATGSTALSINGQPALTGADVLLPLHVAAATTGTYTLTVDALTNLPAHYRVYLRDALTGTATDLTATPTVSLSLTANAPALGRYSLLFTTQAVALATSTQSLSHSVTLFPNPAHGRATLLLPPALQSGTTAVQVVDNLGRVVLHQPVASGAVEAVELPIETLVPGVYSVQVRTATGLVARRLVVQ